VLEVLKGTRPFRPPGGHRSNIVDGNDAPVFAAQNDVQGDADGADEIPDHFETGPSSFAAVVVPLPEADPVPAAPPKNSALARRRQLRELNSEAVRDLAHATGKSHAELNAELNRKIGIKRISLATVRQLEQRLAAARARRR